VNVFRFNLFTPPGALRRFPVYIRKRELAFANAEKLKLLSQRKLTFVNATALWSALQLPSWG